MFVRILRRDADHIGYNRNFLQLYPGEQRTLMKNVFSNSWTWILKNGMNELFWGPSPMLRIMIDDVAYAAQAGDMYTRKLWPSVIAYQKELRHSEYPLFVMMIICCLCLFLIKTDFLTYYQQKFQYIHTLMSTKIPTTLSTNWSILASRFKNICVVGDADQSISTVGVVLICRISWTLKRITKAKVVSCWRKYRSTKTILQAANEVIKNNKNRRPKNLWTQNALMEHKSYYRADVMSWMRLYL